MRERVLTAALASALLVGFYAISPVEAGPEVHRNAETLTVDLDNGAVLHFALQDGILLGLNRAVVEDVELTSRDTVQRPVLAQEYAQDRHIFPLLRLERAAVDGEEVRIETTLLATDANRAYREFFVFAGDRQAALEKGRTEKLDRLARRKEQASAELEAAVGQQDDVRRRRKQVESIERKVASADNPERQKLQRQLEQARRRLEKVRNRTRERLLEEDRFSEAADAVAAYERELDRIALEYGDIHRDYYLLPHVRLPAEICRLARIMHEAA